MSSRLLSINSGYGSCEPLIFSQSPNIDEIAKKFAHFSTQFSKLDRENSKYDIEYVDIFKTNSAMLKGIKDEHAVEFNASAFALFVQSKKDPNDEFNALKLARMDHAISEALDSLNALKLKKPPFFSRLKISLDRMIDPTID
jgi:hypothetical protein